MACGALWLPALCLAFAGCATAVSFTDAPMTEHDKDTVYAVEDRPDGFSLTVRYARYQFIPESTSVAIACRAALTSIAWEVAERRGKKIDPVNEQRIRISMGRNGLTGITSCEASALAAWRS